MAALISTAGNKLNEEFVMTANRTTGEDAAA
jgi:hypothetical protein